MKSVESNGILWIYDPESPDDFDDYKSNKEVYDYLRKYENFKNIRSMQNDIQSIRKTQDRILIAGSIIGGAILVKKAVKWIRKKKAQDK